jgi:hypothetical protein
MVIGANGNVGINCATPSYNLDVNGCGRFTGALTAGTISGTTIYGNTAVCSAVGKFTTCIDAGSGTFSSSVTAGTIIQATSTGVDGTFAPAFNALYNGDTSFYGTIAHSMSSIATASGFRFLGGGKDNLSGSAGQQKMLDLTRGQIILYTTDTPRLTIASTGAACFACELTAKTLGTNDLILNNLNYECANYVDGTRGSWLIQEGESDLFIINQISCKKYKFNLTEIK